MTLQLFCPIAPRQIRMMTQSSDDRKDSPSTAARSPAEGPSSLESVFRRRLIAGVGSASLVAVGANFAGITSYILGFSPAIGRNLKLDVLYPIGGYSRCLETSRGFEFMYPASWVGDQTLVYRAEGKAESDRLLDPPPLKGVSSGDQPRRRRLKTDEPSVAFGPPGSSGELNVSVIVSPVPQSFSFEAFGGGEPKEVGERIIGAVAAGSARGSEVRVTLTEAGLREDPLTNVKYYELEFAVESPSFRRRNVAVCCAHNGYLYTLNAQAPESLWPKFEPEFYEVAHSFSLTS